MKNRTSATILLLAVAALPVLPQTAPAASIGAAAPAVGLYRIAGTVVNSATGEAVSRATVAVLSTPGSHTLQSALTGEDGRFALEGLPAAKLQLTASKRGYTTTFYNQHEHYNSAIVTGEGQPTENLIFRLAPIAMIRGQVTADGGDPVEAASVMLFLKPRGHNPGDRIVQVDSASTDDSGAYEFANLDPGEYLLAVKAEPWYALRRSSGVAAQRSQGDPAAKLDVAYPVTYFDSTTDEASASPIVLAAGSRAEANLSLYAVPALHLTVQLPDKRKESVAPTELRQTIFGTEVFSATADFSDDSKPIRTDEFSGLAPGHYELQQGDPPRLLELNAASSQQIDPSAGTPTVAVSGTLHPVSDSAMTGEFSLRMAPYDGSINRRSVRSTASDGQFSFPAVASGAWVLWAVSSGKEWPVLSIAADGKTRSGNRVTVQDCDLTLSVTVSQSATRIEGFARKNGKELAGAMIVLVPQNPGANANLFRRDQSDSDGSFALLDVIPGQYKIVAIEDGWELDWALPEVIARYLSDGIAVSIDGNSGKLIRLSQPVPVQPR